MTISSEKEATWSDKFGARHNERRKLKYKDDSEYREGIIKSSREGYRRQQGIELETCLERLPDLETYGEPRTVSCDGKVYAERVCFTMAELAIVIGNHRAPLVYRWLTRDLLPRPIAKANVYVETTGRGGSYWQEQDVYFLEEVRAVVEVIGEHQKQVKYYRAQDVETRDKLFAAVDAARNRI